MAASDYKAEGNASFTSAASLTASVGPLDTSLAIGPVRRASGDTYVPGEPVMVNGEIMRLTGILAGSIEVARGCADTVPRSHAVGSTVWFMSDNVGSDRKLYLSGQKVAVKILPRTPGGRILDVASSLPTNLTFDFRFIRPYPPGKLTVNNAPWFALTAFTSTLNLVWTHRDRVIQADQLIEHNAGSIGPEPGTTYMVEVFDATNKRVATYPGITGTTFSYSLAQAAIDLGASVGVLTGGYLKLYSRRDGYFSREGYRINFSLTSAALGWGEQWGATWGT